MIGEENVLKAYKKLSDKISNIKQKGCDGDPVYNEKYLETKISYGYKINTNFNGVHKEVCHCVCLLLLLLLLLLSSLLLLSLLLLLLLL